MGNGKNRVMTIWTKKLLRSGSPCPRLYGREYLDECAGSRLRKTNATKYGTVQARLGASDSEGKKQE